MRYACGGDDVERDGQEDGRAKNRSHHGVTRMLPEKLASKIETVGNSLILLVPRGGIEPSTP